MKMKLRNIFLNLGLAVVSTVLLFLILEGVFRFIPIKADAQNPLRFLNPFWEGHNFFESDRELFWKFKPGITIDGQSPGEGSYSIPINNLGFRGENYDPQKYETYSRVLCLGDSCTFSWEVPDDKDYPHQLENLLRQKYKPKLVKVINCGVPAYSSFQMLRLYKQYVDYFKPEIVVLWTCSNDASDAFLYSDKEKAAQQERFYFLRTLLLKSRFCSYLMEHYQRIRSKHLSPKAMAEKMRDGHVLRVSMPDFKSNLTEFVTLTRQNNQHLILLTRHTFQASNPLLDEYNGIIKQVGRENNIPVIDMVPLANGEKHKNLYADAPKDAVHLNSFGCATVANEVYKTIVENKFM
jgi:lysophospholipase L1-like esterase